MPGRRDEIIGSLLYQEDREKILSMVRRMGNMVSEAIAGAVQSLEGRDNALADRIIEANGLMSEQVEPGRPLFLPDARLASFKLREISGDLFRWPVRGWITTWYGRDKDPFTGAPRFHNGIDIGVDMWTPVQAAMDGYVADTGYSSGLGNYILLSHHAGWASLYGHLQSVSVKRGQRVSLGTRLGYSGNTGYSTGPHLHFSVFKNGRAVNPANVLH
jgi:murein DD-endopeptidase MepM/ murein hydrolase activator NlpD